MYRKNVSGQPVYFSLVSTASGLPITSGATSISGRRCIDAGAMTLVSGTFTEDGGGLYHLNGYAEDFNGNVVGFLFSASGSTQVTYNVVTDGNSSGRIWLSSGQSTATNSGQSVLVYSGQLSGQQTSIASGTIYLASGHQAALYSGQVVQVYSGNLSGQQITTRTNMDKSGYVSEIQSGTTFLAQASLFVGTYASGVLTAYLPDQVIQRDFTASSGVIASGLSGRCVVNAMRKLVNKFNFTALSGFLTVFQEDDATVAFQQQVTTASGSPPIGSLDTR